MRFEATLLAALAVLAPVPAAAQTAPPSGTPAAAPGGAAPEEQGESGSDEQGEASDQGQTKSNAAPAESGEAAAEQTADNSDDADEDDTPEAGSAPPLIPPAADALGGHFSVAGSAGVAVPFGDLQQSATQTRVMGAGWGFGAELGYGISRSVVLGVWGQGLKLGGGSSCKDCSTTSFAVGPFVRYHLVQGVRFDPWMSAGLGFRTTKIAGAPGGDLSYSGLEWLRLRVGGDWYAFSKLGFGPFFELDAGHYLSRPSQAPGGASAHLAFTTGIRLIVDLPGK